MYETYGRTLRIETIEATGGPADATAAQADAQKAIDLKPFAAVGGPAQTPAYWQELIAAGIVCVGACSLAEPWDVVEDAAPYLWPTGPNPDQADAHLVEMVGKQLVDQPASFGGDDVNGQDRVFGWIQAETETGEYTARNDAFDQKLADEYGAEIATRYTYIFDTARAAEIASTAIARMKDAGVTTVILSVDPFIPADITKEATAQNYFPEWVLGPSVLMDTTIFGRQTDQQQWSNMIGISLGAARAERELGDSYVVYEWYYGTEPPVNSQAVVLPGPHTLLRGIHLAGPNLTPETFKDRIVPVPTRRAGPHEHVRVMGRAAVGPSPTTTAATTSVRCGGTPKRPVRARPAPRARACCATSRAASATSPATGPTDPIPFFEEEGSVTIYDTRPDAAPDYPPWPGSPAAGG